MNILSESDFDRLKSTGLLYVVEPECNGDYSDYLKIYGEEPTMAEKEYDLGNIKIRIKDAEHSRCVQEHLFKMGCSWMDGTQEQNVVEADPDVPFIFVYADGLITYTNSDEHYNQHDNIEYAFSDKEIGYMPPANSLKGILGIDEFPNEEGSFKVFGGAREGGKSILRDVSSGAPMPNVKPPLGLRPKHIVAKERMQEILEAMGRYVEEGKKIPVEWFDELDDINENSHV